MNLQINDLFKLKYSNRFQNQIYTKYNISFPEEDFHLIKGNVFCVADGVTRDLYKGEVRPYPKTKEEAEYIAKNYPNPSGAYEASKIISNNFVKYVSEKAPTKQNVFKSIKKANKDVWKINENRNIDYVGEDLYCCEAVGGVIDNNYLYCFSIGDCYIKIYDKNINEIFSTENDHLYMEMFEEEYLKEGEYNWLNPRYRLLIRGALRNNSIVTHNGKCVGYGALTGEDSAMKFVKIYKVNLKNAKYICAYSDGCMEYFETKEKVTTTINCPEIIKNGGSERTLVIYEKK